MNSRGSISGNNQAADRDFRRAMNKAGINDKGIARQIHDAISGLGLDKHEIYEFA